MNDKIETLESQLDAIDQAALTPLVRSALGNQTVEVDNWEREQVHGGLGVRTAIYRFSGQGHDQGQTIAWSLILKILRPEGGGADMSACNSYRREVDAYRSGWLDGLTGGLVAPHCFGLIENPDGTCWMWLEDIRDMFNAQWPLAYYGTVARHLGHFNGIYLTGEPLPSWPWLSCDWLRQYVGLSASAMEPLRDALESPWGCRFLPEDDCDQFFHLWAERERYLAALDRLPQTICHLDAFCRNLFARKTKDGEDQTVAIDWAFVGHGPVGAELSPLILMSIALGGVGLDKLQELEQIAFDGYLEGLRQAGWRGNPRQVRLGYTAASVRYLFPEIERWLAIILDESLHAGLEQAAGISVGQACDFMAAMRLIYFDYLDEARSLMDILL
jgi:hypothetical protein